MPSEFDLDSLTFTDAGLIPVIVQDDVDSQVLMMAWMNKQAITRTLDEQRMVYWSRSRQEYWRKGDTSGHIQELISLAHDCDSDVLLARVIQTGAACHTGSRSCFDDREIFSTVQSPQEAH